jgi:hypothetical protein
VLRHFAKSFKTWLDVGDVFLEDCFTSLFLDLQSDSILIKFVFQLFLKLFIFRIEFFLEHFDLPLIDFIFAKVLHYLVHSDQELSPICYFAYDLMFHPNVVSPVSTKERTICTDTDSILNANDLELATMLRTKILITWQVLLCHKLCLLFCLFF